LNIRYTKEWLLLKTSARASQTLQPSYLRHVFEATR